MAARKNRAFRERQIQGMWDRRQKINGLIAPLLAGGLVILVAAVFLGLSALGILAFVTAMACLGRGIGYWLEASRLKVSIEAAETRLEAASADDD